ncbi:MAG: hypothetical protein IKJ46_00465 [Tidjanibacter sp.]|nr:hypothetical protein [Tidjanibacter sp.]
MKMRNKHIVASIATMAALVGGLVGCQQDPNVEFGLDVKEPLSVEAVGGVERVRVYSAEKWTASTNVPWLTISPANGNGSTECQLVIDSALTTEGRNCKIYIENLASGKTEEIVVNQKGFDYAIELEENVQNLANYDMLENRKFSVMVKSNIDFDVKIPEGINWLSNKNHTLNLNRGERPRMVEIEFEWDINTKAEERIARVEFVPKKSGVELARQDVLEVVQKAAEPIEEGTRAGDSVALISIQRALRTLSMWDTSIPMERWENVVLWEEKHEGYKEEYKGRVKRVQFYMYNTNEPLPYEFKYLIAAEEIYIFGNTNTFLKDLTIGEEITTLTQLKRLTIGAHGLISVDEKLARLHNLEYLDLCANNFATVPEVLTKENFPKLRTLILNANQRSTINDLSNTTKTNLGGFIEEKEFPKELLLWGLDTLVLSVNYLQGELPDFLDDDSVPCYTEEDRIKGDSLPEFLVQNKIKKVMPHAKRFSINFNRLTGDLPDWLLYHPSLDLWLPYSLVFPQEGRNQAGQLAKFNNEPPNLDYYYKLYPFKKQPTDGDEEGAEE